jgi:hypothetical protein
VRNVRTWWEVILAQVELVAADLFEFIRDAQDIDLGFSGECSTFTVDG